jgi:hypothetical protein
VSKVGKRMALAIRVDSIAVKDGWDICDSVLVDIDRGVVNTLNYGSGYWTIWGWSWQLYPDGHTDLTLSISPRLDAEAPDGSLIDSDPISTGSEWVVGAGGPPADSGDATTWVDSVTGDIWQYDPNTGAWVNQTATQPGAPKVMAFSMVETAYLDDDAVTEPKLAVDSVSQEKIQDGAVGTDEIADGAITIDKIDPGAIPGGDIEPPPIPTIKSLVALEATQQDDGTTVSALRGMVGYVGGGSIAPVDIAYNDPRITRYGIAIPDYTGYGGVPCDVYNNSLPVALEFDIDGPVDLDFKTFGGYAQLIVDGVDIAFLIGPSVGTAGTSTA